jgi:hypothetical protein
MKAAEECNSDMMKFYIDNGADINIQSGKGFTAFDVADFYYKKAVKRKRGPDRKEWVQMYKNVLDLLTRNNGKRGKGFSQ